jgi:tripartite-type tricarboxylate transporter receptor subunit TctC
MWARLLSGMALMLACGAGWAQGYPAKAVRVIVPYPPGGGTDTIARPLAQKLTESFGQQVIIDNRGGAGGNVGMELAARAAPDGYTLVIGLTAQLAVNPALYRKLPYDPVKDYEPITLIGAGAYLLVVHPSLPVKDVKELVALAKARPGQITYASSGNGSGGHLCMELFKTMTGTNFVHVPYKGGGPALVDTLAGQVQVLFTPPVSATQHVQSGRLRALAVSTVRRSSGMPDLPTIAESGVPGYDSGVWYGVLAPAGTPREIVMRVNGDVVKALQQPDFRTMLVANSIDPIGSSPEVLAQFIRIEMAKWAKVVREADVRVD